MKRIVKDMAEEILQDFTNCYNEEDEEYLAKMIETVASDVAREMREELVRYLMLNENIAIKCKEENGEWNAEYWKGKLSAFKQIQGFIDTELKEKYTQEK